MQFGALAFSTPWLLIALIALPILWLLLRAVPPAPIRRMFPGVILLLGLKDDENQSDKTPWWLLLLRSLMIGALILAFAGPVLNPQQKRAGSGPLLILLDGTWADAQAWSARLDRVGALLDEAGQSGRPVNVTLLTDPPQAITFRSADSWASGLAGFTPKSWTIPREKDWITSAETGFDTYWLSDGLARDDRMDTLNALETRGTVTVFEGGVPPVALTAVRYSDGGVLIDVIRLAVGSAQEITLSGYGLDPQGQERVLVRGTANFAAGENQFEVKMVLPAELRNRITRFQIDGVRSAGAVTLTDDALKRREVALIAGRDDREGLELLAPLHYLRKALAPTADLLEVPLNDALLSNPDVIIMADVAKIPETQALEQWVNDGGMLVRFAGPRLAASDVARDAIDPLMPVRLRQGGRNIGGAMSWGEPKSLRPFAKTSPFYGLPEYPEVTVSAQVVAQPDPELSSRSIATLADGTPLVTRKALGQGQVILFHVTANAEWSTLPLSGLFVQMLERLAITTRATTPSEADLSGTVWAVEHMLDGFGDLGNGDNIAGVSGKVLADVLSTGAATAQVPPGIYATDDRRIALNVLKADAELKSTAWPVRIRVEGLSVLPEVKFMGWLLLGAMVLLMLDVIASLLLSGRLRGGMATAMSVLIFSVFSIPDAAKAQDDIRAIEATAEVVMAYVLTGDTTQDNLSAAGLRGLGDNLFRRTSIEPATAIGVDLETDELAFYPLIYWPIVATQKMPSNAAYIKLNSYLRTGGMILFDTRDADIGGFGAATAEGRQLQRFAAPLDIPALEPLPEDHVLTRSFYLLQDFPGRYQGRDIWVEASPPVADAAEGMPFRNLNDGVTPVVIGGNDWAAAWATDQAGNWMLPVGRGFAGERQREIALRFGVNLMMYVLTGNYKSDQVHVPALLDRLGQ
ncbi:hypothetical protein RB2150_14061 [Rhodobacteraceae bacterium HTCC2150]|nr:hypothetical protein RB2150_14061 [Rhodobacteraceae bacterium HTCC2150]